MERLDGKVALITGAIRVNSVHPTGVATPMIQNAAIT